MEVFMTKISSTTTKIQLLAEIAKVVHGPLFTQFNQNGLLNFDVYLHQPRKVRSFLNSFLTGVVTFPTTDIGRLFLDVCGGATPRFTIRAGYMPVIFRLSNKPARIDVLERIRRLPFRDPQELQKTEDKRQTLENAIVHFAGLQFGWECRDEVLSVEYETKTPSQLFFSSDSRELRVYLAATYGEEIIRIPFSHIRRASISRSADQVFLYFNLRFAPSFELSPAPPEMSQELVLSDFDDVFSTFARQESPTRSRVNSLQDENYQRISPYICYAIRLICASSEYEKFPGLWELAQANVPIVEDNCRAEYRDLFSACNLSRLDHWIKGLEWPLAFYADALVRNGTMDPKELLDMQPFINRVLLDKGNEYTCGFLRFYRQQLNMFWFSERTQSHETIEDCFWRCFQEYKHIPTPMADDLFHCLHVIVTPTGHHLDGPFPDQTNRVLRSYPNHKDHFLRVSFVEENGLHFRFDRQVNGRAFIDTHVGRILRTGLYIGGRQFDFLHYSQSALKDHAVWFVCPFNDLDRHVQVDAGSIIKSLGTFDDLKFDSRLIYCPARYAARISQAFTTTDSSISVDLGEIVIEDDIKSRSGSVLTDGIGTVSIALADEMWRLLCAKKRRGFQADRPRPRAFQIRFQGSKGMISVDHTLPGRVLVLRPSMIKFESTSTQIEIAGVFNKPVKMYLNRPLIMLLEGRGVPGKVFIDLQKQAVKSIMSAFDSLEATAVMLNTYGLGQSFRLPSILLSLAELGRGRGHIPTDYFFTKAMQNAVFHILRGFKHKARIPVPGWTLVGVADIYSYLKEGEVFVCLEEEKGVKKYLHGPVSISRSPTIHPGDVQLAHAIGPPPSDSPFQKEQLQNTVVFSTKGERSLPSCLGGGDLDGDIYNVTDCPDLLPRNYFDPASYDAAQRKELDHPSTKDDVIDFIVDYINADNVGVIATNWLTLADRSSYNSTDPNMFANHLRKVGIYHPDCLKLAKLHSDAVDYPKSGKSVPMEEVPDTKGPKPDWSEPETGSSDPKKYYPSERALGHLYRSIDLSQESLRALLSDTQLSSETDHNHLRLQDPLCQAIKSRVSETLNTRYPPALTHDQQVHIDNIFRKYSSELRFICISYTMSNGRYSKLSEAEAFIGTIRARTTQPKRRQDLTSGLREHTAQLVTDTRYEIMGGDKSSKTEKLHLAWAAWNMSLDKMKESAYGAQSFFWVALGALFEGLKSVEEKDAI